MTKPFLRFHLKRKYQFPFFAVVKEYYAWNVNTGHWIKDVKPINNETKSLIRFSIILGTVCGFGIGMCLMYILIK